MRDQRTVGLVVALLGALLVIAKEWFQLETYFTVFLGIAVGYLGIVLIVRADREQERVPDAGDAREEGDGEDQDPESGS